MASIQSQTNALEPVTLLNARSALAEEPRSAVGEHRFLIRNIDWATYRKISDALVDRHYHMSFDGKDLELMTTHIAHDRYSRFICRMVAVLTEELELPLDSGGQFTMEREDLGRAIEADETFYIENESRVRGKNKIDLSVDPPPDLGAEIDLTTDSRRRLDIYAKIGIPEIWRFDGRDVTIYLRQPDGQYVIAERSRLFPFLTAVDLGRFLRQRDHSDENALLRSFRQWVREKIASSK